MDTAPVLAIWIRAGGTSIRTKRLQEGMILDSCVICGQYVPEGWQVCRICEYELEEGEHGRVHTHRQERGPGAKKSGLLHYCNRKKVRLLSRQNLQGY